VPSISVNDLTPNERIASFVGVSVVFLVPAYLSARDLGLSLIKTTDPAAMVINEAAIWSVALALLAIVIFWERNSLESIGVGRPTWDAIRLGALCTAPLLVLSMGMGALLHLLGAPAGDNGQAGMILALPLWLQFFVAITAGVTEEILFRGYAVERVALLTGSQKLGAIIPILIFGHPDLDIRRGPRAILGSSPRRYRGLDWFLADPDLSLATEPVGQYRCACLVGWRSFCSD
jgi:membrane protease YdiL (CAAX protease family)